MASPRETIAGATHGEVTCYASPMSSIFFALALLVAAGQIGAEKERSGTFAEDYRQLADFVFENYAFFGTKTVDWDAVVEHDLELARTAEDVDEFIAIAERSLDELYDPHSHLGTHRSSSWRLPAHDLWAKLHQGEARVVEVRAGSAAAAADVLVGMVVIEIDGLPTAEALAERMPRFLREPDSAAEAWALLSALSGRRDRNRVLKVRLEDGSESRITIADSTHSAPRVDDIRATRQGDFLLVRITNFGEPRIVATFDQYLEEHRGVRGLLFDVRDNSGGDTAIARPIMGRLIDERQAYAWMARRQGKELGSRWQEFVEARGPWTFEGPVVVIVNHWSTSMAEGFAMGLDGMQRATVVGTRMAGLGAAIGRVTLEHTGIAVQISTEPVYHLNGSPREEFVPAVLVEARSDEDAIELAGLRALSEALEKSER